MRLHGAPRNGRLALAAILGLGLASCFDPPVREDLHLRFLANGAVVATSTTRISADQDTRNTALSRRLADARRAILEGSDAWGARFALAKPAAERFWWEKRLGELAAASRSAVITEPDGLEALFGDTSVAATYKVDPEQGLAELVLVPGTATRANRRQRQEMEKTLEVWTAALAQYLQSAGDLYAYLERQPDRARNCFGLLFSDLLEERRRRSFEEPTEEEAALLERLQDAMQQVADVLLVPQRAEYSPDEVSRLVYDPFPARLTVKLPGAPLEVEGFDGRREDGALLVAGLSLWEALRKLEGRWLAPDPVLFYVDNARRGREGMADVDSFLHKPRQIQYLPAAEEVRQAIEERLRPAPLYRASWRVQPDDDPEFHWSEEEGSP